MATNIIQFPGSVSTREADQEATVKRMNEDPLYRLLSRSIHAMEALRVLRDETTKKNAIWMLEAGLEAIEKCSDREAQQNPPSELLRINVEDLLPALTAGGRGALCWTNGFRCPYEVRWEDGEGAVLLEAYGRPLWEELWPCRSPKLGKLTLKCYRCGRKNQTVYIRVVSEDSHQWNCGCEFEKTELATAARIVAD